VIEITLTFHGKQIDLLVPGAVTFDRLTRLIGDAFADKGTRLPDGFSLALDDKALVMSGSDLVSSVGVANGDRLRIETKE
jgi:uncharacterized ubiquitin-like protein YukD